MEYLDLPDDALLDAIREAVRWHWDEPLPPEEVSHNLQLADMVLLLGDQNRVWWRVLEGEFRRGRLLCHLSHRVVSDLARRLRA